MQKLEILIYVYIPQTGVQSTLSVLILGGAGGHTPSRNFLKISSQKSEFDGILATKITCII